MNKVFIVLIYLVICNYANAQLITGTIKDAKTNENLPYVNIGIVAKGVGTVSNVDGTFKIALTNYDADSLRVSMLGYIPQSFLVADLKKRRGTLNISLAPNTIQLKEVRISNRKYKTSVLGNTSTSQSFNAGFTSNSLGHEIGAIIKIKRSPTWLKQFNASLAGNIVDSVKLRFNIYSVKNGLPDKSLLVQNIFTTVKKGQKLITIDLEQYNIMVEDKFFVSLEWIENTHGQGLMFSASFLSSAIIARETSQANWEKFGIAGIGFNVLAEY
jgi:hypothetical protein